MRMLRILCPQISFHPHAGGSRADYEILASLSRLGYEIQVLMPRLQRGRTPIPAGVNVRYIPVRGLGFPQSLGLAFLPWLLAEAKRFCPDLIRVHSPYAFGLACLVVGRLCRIPTVASFHHSFETFTGSAWTERYLLCHFSHVTTVSRFALSQLAQLDPCLSAKSSVVYNGVSSRFAPKDYDIAGWRRARGLQPASPLFSTVGSLIPRKNTVWLVELMAAWIEAGHEGELVIVGNGPEKALLARKIAESGLEGWIHLWGTVSDADHLSLLRASTAFLLPSLMEGFGLAPAEALACGTPAIVSDCGALPEVVTDGVTGFVRPIDRGAGPWIETMTWLCHDDALRAQMGQAAAADVRQRFNWDRAGRETAAIYERVVQNMTGHRC